MVTVSAPGKTDLPARLAYAKTSEPSKGIPAPRLVPVDHDPFNAVAPSQPKLIPVDHDPFAANQGNGSAGMFDDLIPKANEGPSNNSSQQNKPAISFDDLIPANWSDLPSNVLPSARKAVVGLASIIRHPVDAMNGHDGMLTGAGLNAQSYIRSKLPDWANNASDTIDSFTDPYLARINPMIQAKQNPQVAAQDQALADAMGQALKARYGGFDKIKNTLITDPVGSVMDVGTLALGGEGVLSRAGLESSRMADALRIVQKATNPITPIALGSKLAGKVATYPMGFLSGASPDAIQLAAKTGATGSDAGQAFRSNMRGDVPLSNVVDSAKDAMGNLAEQRRAQYLANMMETKAAAEPANTAPIWQKLNDLHGSLLVDPAVGAGDNAASFAPLAKGTPQEFKTLQSMADLLGQWEAHPQGKTPIGLDALKQRLNEFAPSFTDPNAANQGRLVTAMQNAVKDQITEVVPSYNTAMTDYETAMNTKRELEKTLGLGQNTTTDSTIRQLTNAFKNGGNRADNLDRLAEAGAPNLKASIAGQSLSTLAPKGGLAKGLAAALTGSAWWNPAHLAALPLTSPRIVGEAAHKAGQAWGLMNKFGPSSSAIAKALTATHGAEINQDANRNALAALLAH